jgi:hypothetical protein
MILPTGMCVLLSECNTPKTKLKPVNMRSASMSFRKLNYLQAENKQEESTTFIK